MSKPIDLKSFIRDIPDFPKKGIMFKDITTALKDPEIFRYMADAIAEMYVNKGITKVVGIESRGFILGSIIAYKLNAGFVPVRKPGKLPADTWEVSYSLEYGEGKVEMHKDAITKDDVVLLHDDLLATGGTALAGIKLINLCGAKKIYTNFICELSFLDGRKELEKVSEVTSLFEF